MSRTEDHCRRGCHGSAGRRPRARDSRRSGRRLCRARHHPRHQVGQGGGAGGARRGSGRGGHRRRGEHRASLCRRACGAIASRSIGTTSRRRRSWRRRAAWRGQRSRAGVRHAIWSTLEDTRKRVPLSDDRMPTLMGHYKVPHFDAKGEADHFSSMPACRRPSCSRPSTGTTSSPSAWVPSPAPTARCCSRCRWGTRSFRASRRKTSAGCAYGIFKRGRDLIGKRVGVAGDHLTGTEMAARFRARSDGRFATTRSRRKRFAASAFPAPTTSATCSSSSATSSASSAERAMWRSRTSSIPRC